MKGRHQIASTNSSAASNLVRIIVYLDRQCNGAAAGVTDLLESASYLSFRNLANQSRFKFLYDKTIPINVVASTITT